VNPEVSVVIPLYNKGHYIKRAICSVLAQTIQSFEIIIIDGGSIDEGPAIVKEMADTRIHFLVQKGKGVSNARNEAVNFAKSDFIAFLDADDEWMPEHLETILKLKKSYPHAGAYTTAYKIMEGSGKIRWAKYREIPFSPWEGLIPNYFKSGALGEYPVWTSVVCIPKKIFTEMGGFPEGAWFGEDADLFGKIALKYRIAFSWYHGAIYHWDAHNRACNHPYPIDAEPFVKTALNLIENGKVPKELLSDLKEYIAKKEIYRAKRNLTVGRREESLKILRTTQSNYFFYKRLTVLFWASIPYPLFRIARYLMRTFLHFLKGVKDLLS